MLRPNDGLRRPAHHITGGHLISDDEAPEVELGVAVPPSAGSPRMTPPQQDKQDAVRRAQRALSSRPCRLDAGFQVFERLRSDRNYEGRVMSIDREYSVIQVRLSRCVGFLGGREIPKPCSRRVSTLRSTDDDRLDRSVDESNPQQAG